MNMKLPFYSLLLILMTPTAFSATRGADQNIDCNPAWKTIQDQATHYEEKKDSAAGKKLWESLPTGHKIFPTDCDSYSTANEYLYTHHHYLDSQLLKGDALAFQIAFRMLNVSDGAFSEDLNVSLGKSIQKNAKKFLQFLKAEHGEKYCPVGLVKNLGESDLDEKILKAEFKKRIKALSAVKDKSLTRNRDACLNAFKEIQD
jgi:hypothetical protein